MHSTWPDTAHGQASGGVGCTFWGGGSCWGSAASGDALVFIRACLWHRCDPARFRGWVATTSTPRVDTRAQPGPRSDLRPEPCFSGEFRPVWLARISRGGLVSRWRWMLPASSVGNECFQEHGPVVSGLLHLRFVVQQYGALARGIDGLPVC